MFVKLFDRIEEKTNSTFWDNTNYLQNKHL